MSQKQGLKIRLQVVNVIFLNKEFCNFSLTNAYRVGRPGIVVIDPTNG